MSLVRRGLTGVINALLRRLRNNGCVLVRTFHSLLNNQHHRATTVPVTIKANGNFSDLERLASVSVIIKRVTSPSDAIDLESTLV